MHLQLNSGRSLFYSTAGAGETALVFLHPVGLRSQMWADCANRLAGSYRTLCVDLPGHGESTFGTAQDRRVSTSAPTAWTGDT